MRLVNKSILVFFDFALRPVKAFYWSILNVFYKLGIYSVYEIPVFINNFNRITTLKLLIDFLEKCGFKKIIILDNGSTYPPLLNYYKECSHKVLRLSNHGHLAFWKSGLYAVHKWNYFVNTDSDVVPVNECPTTFIEHFKSILDAYYSLDKIGFGIKIDDLPDSFDLRDQIINYENQYWKKKIKPNLYDAPIDTTFALYKPLTGLKNDHAYLQKAFRTGPPYVVRHLPWYINSRSLTEEERFYVASCNTSSSLGQHQRGVGTVY
ncbi:MAG: glycosyltransferase family 2 protein [Flammeovirgaceae bacterium]|nr:glycosyltransferase family 2 protein [Flammeovirgaceae bacterium]